MAMRGPIRELLPLPEQRVRIALPAGAAAAKVHLLVADRAPAVEAGPGYVEVRVPAILDHEVVAVDL
jgi:hypothetical protein